MVRGFPESRLANRVQDGAECVQTRIAVGMLRLIAGDKPMDCISDLLDLALETIQVFEVSPHPNREPL